MQIYGRLRHGVSAALAEAGLQPLYKSILEREASEAAFADASADTKRQFLEGKLRVDDASKGHSNLRASITTPLLILMGVAAGVLLIVCANVANLLIARGAARHRELALRLAVGASRSQIVRLLLVESLVLAIGGAALGLLVAGWGADLLLGYFQSPENAVAVSPEPDARILAFTSLLAVATALVAGIIPAFRSTRVDLAPTLKGSGGGVVSEQPHLRKTLVVAQVALSFLLLIGAGLFVRSLQNLLAVDPGFHTDRVVTFNVDPSRANYDAERARTFAQALLDAANRTPGVVSVGLLLRLGPRRRRLGHGLHRRGLSAASGRAAGSMANAVSPGYSRRWGFPSWPAASSTIATAPLCRLPRAGPTARPS